MASGNPDVKEAVERLSARQGRYNKYRNYYEGDHPLAFATDKFSSAFGRLFQAFADNLCAVVVDALADRVRLEGFAVDKEGDFPEWDLALQEFVDRNKLLLRAGEIHQEVFRSGDAYAIVLPDRLGDASLYVNRGDQMTVAYDEETSGSTLRWAAKWWREAGRLRLNMYYPDRVEKYQAGTTWASGLDGARGLRLFEEFTHGYGRVPVFHFANNASLGDFGRSELKDITPLQDALNKSVMDLMVAMEFVALPQRWVAGLELEKDKLTGRVKWPFEAGVDRVWAVDDPNTKFGEFPSTNLEQFLKTQESFRLEIARISGTPLHYLMMTAGNFPSGESMKTAEARAITKTEDRTQSLGETWREVAQFALWLDLTQDVPITTEWKDTAPRSEKEFADTLLVHQQLGAVFLRRLGYSEQEIEEILKDKEAELAAQQIVNGQDTNPDTTGDGGPAPQDQPPPPNGLPD
jgi:hypothetical protein